MTGNPENGALMEIACDESGSDGENLTGGNTDVFAHASVRLPVETAAEYVQEIRRRIRSPATEYKANHLLRDKHRAVLESFLDPAGPLRGGNAHVHLIEKTFFIVDRAVGLLLGEDGDGDGDEAVTLFREGPLTFGEHGWRDFLAASNQLLRVRNDAAATVPADVFFRTVDTLRDEYSGTTAGVIVGRLAAARSRAESYRERMRDSPVLFPVLNPLLPAIVSTARYWLAGGRSVRLVHDRQNMLTPERIAWIMESAPLSDVQLVAARSDARVQLADFLAGIARKLASDELNGRGDPALTALLRPYIGTDSVWGDAGSGLRLGTAEANSAV
ncbi:hypothetical protein OG194_03225 [Streptomyces sp. NBC_01288]|uniref:hypothetical protein n=1 Tax=Streptomyces sp. NBC_01288 TaxID=2903814 RepID=UPI002E12881B|nr:hypothetical protein OG194_03225 [Streptomyces sp. NBC_01288]